MKKIPSVFKRDYDGDRLVYDEVTPGCEWVLAGEGTPTIKYDGTACLIKDGKLYKRYDCKPGRTPPENWEPCEPVPNEHTGHWPGWVPVGDGPEDKWFREVWEEDVHLDGTYELIGPKVQNNPYGVQSHMLIAHGEPLKGKANPRTFDEIKQCLETLDIEGIVWHNTDGRMAKIKRKDFGFDWPIKDKE